MAVLYPKFNVSVAHIDFISTNGRTFAGKTGGVYITMVEQTGAFMKHPGAQKQDKKRCNQDWQKCFLYIGLNEHIVKTKKTKLPGKWIHNRLT